MYVYAFYRLCKLHNISNGSAEDFLRLGPVLRSDKAFRSGVFRLAASVMSSEPEVSVKDVVVIVALAVGGDEILASDELEAPDDLIEMFRSVLTPDGDGIAEPVRESVEAEGAGGAATSGMGAAPPAGDVGVGRAPAAAARAAAVPVRAAETEPSPGPPAAWHVARPSETVPPPRMEPILPAGAGAGSPVPPGVAHPAESSRAPDPSGLPPPHSSYAQSPESSQVHDQRPAAAVGAAAAAPEVFAKVARLESERDVLERRMQEMEQRLTEVVHEVESLAIPARAEAAGGGRGSASIPARSFPAAPGADEEPVLTHRGAHRGMDRDPDQGAHEGPRHRPAAREAPGGVGDWPERERREFGGRADTGERRRAGDDVAMESPLRLVAAEGEKRRWTPLSVGLGLLVLFVVVAGGIFLVGRMVRGHGVAERAASVLRGSVDMAGDDSTPEAPAKPAAGTAAMPQGRAEAEAEISKVLTGWASASAGNDPVAESAYYAPRVDRYFLKRDVSRQYVLHDKQAYRERGNRMQQFSISGLSFQFLSANSALVTLTKTWSVVGPEQTGMTHSSRSRVWLTRTPGGWQITGEQDLR